MCLGKSTMLGNRKGLGIGCNPKCVGVGELVGIVPCLLLPVPCVSVL